MILYLIRHGESVANKSGIIQGRMEFPLSEAGEKQAKLLGDFFASKSIDYLYTSDLKRAYDTALAISANIPIDAIKWDQLREIGLGPLEGKTREEIYLQFPHVKDTPSLLTTGLEGTEKAPELTIRFKNVLDQLLDGHKHKTVALVSHGGFISIFLMYVMFGEKWPEAHRPFVIGNTGVTKIEFIEWNKPIFHYVNNDAHLLLGNERNERIIY